LFFFLPKANIDPGNGQASTTFDGNLEMSLGYGNAWPNAIDRVERIAPPLVGLKNAISALCETSELRKSSLPPTRASLTHSLEFFFRDACAIEALRNLIAPLPLRNQILALSG
jgi:hypothetical protein